MDKYQLILNALQQLIMENKGEVSSVSDIAKQAGIGKGSIYYYFKSKEEILDALVEREYGLVIENCKQTVAQHNLPAMQKMALLFQTYLSSSTNNAVDKYMHEPENAFIHQKSLAFILLNLSPVLQEILAQGVAEQVFTCKYPEEYAQFILTQFCFLFDKGIFQWTGEQIFQKLQAFVLFVENALQAPQGSFLFLTDTSFLENQS